MMLRACNSVLVAIAVASFTATMAFAGFLGHHHSSEKSTNIDILQTTRVPDGPTLQPGTYRATFIENPSKPEVEFYREGKLVGQAPVKLVDQGQKIKQTEFESDKRANGTYVLTELDLSA